MAPVQHMNLRAAETAQTQGQKQSRAETKAQNEDSEPHESVGVYRKQAGRCSAYDESCGKEMGRQKKKTALKKKANQKATTNAGTAKSPRVGLTSSSKAHVDEKPRTRKVIVNKFHAIGLLSTQQHEEKTKLLAQYGLTESEAAAYGASLHASNTTSNSVQSHTSNHDEAETDSDEEKYVAYPFYLHGEQHETQQSRAVRCSPSARKREEGEYYTPKCVLSPSLFPNVAPYINFASHATKGPAVPAALQNVLKWKLSPVLPNVMRRIISNTGFRKVRYSTDWMAIWETHMQNFGFRTIRSHQKYNHMPGSTLIGRKDSMWRSIHKNIKRFGWKEFGFMQKTYIMPKDQDALRQMWPKYEARKSKWIIKPPAGCSGCGIRIVNKWDQFNPDRHVVVQKYIERPLLINHIKFDMRLYVVMTSINPLRLYLHKDGLARFASVKYDADSLSERCMHLTNYSVNKHSQHYSKNENFNSCQGHKWTLQSLWSCLERRGVNTKRLWATLRNLVIRAIISGEPTMARLYNRYVNNRYNCFELLGFDVLLDADMVPWLLEINVSPSLNSDLPVDRHVKGPLVQALLNTALYQVPPKLNGQQQADIIRELKIHCTNLCYDKRLFWTWYTEEEADKQHKYTGSSIREDYLASILQELQPADVRCLILAEDERHRCAPLERIFPTSQTHKYLEFMAGPRYFNRLLDAWEHKYANSRSVGIALLTQLCRKNHHLLGCEEATDKESLTMITEMSQLHTEKADESPHSSSTDSSTSVASKATSGSLATVDVPDYSHDEYNYESPSTCRETV